MTSVAFVVNGDPSSPAAERARAFAHRLRGPLDVRIFYRSCRKVLSLFRLAAELLRWRPQVCYVFDIAYSGVAAGVVCKGLTGNRLIVDTGDAVTDLARSLGRGRLGVALTRGLEGLAYAAADGVVVRGTGHKEWLAERRVPAEVIPDGVECDRVTPGDAAGLRRRYGLDGVLTVGLVGSSVWLERLRWCYGWDLVEVVRLLRDCPVKGVLIGDGSGVAVLQRRCREYGIEDRVVFLGRLPYEQLPRHLGLIDVCLSTQTNDRVGQVRTTGKLPLYLAAGRYVLASRVGEAARVLDDEMLVDYEGTIDPNYPHKLAERLRPLLADRALLGRSAAHVSLAREKFDYDVLAPRVAGVIDGVLDKRAHTSQGGAPARPLRLAVLCDFPEERWPSMDLAAEMCLRELQTRHSARIEAVRVCPPFRRRAGRLPGLSRWGQAHNADRLVNRLWDYPRHLRGPEKFDLFHVCDHSYAQLVHALPPGRAGVFCHDLDAFRSLLEPVREPRPAWFRALARHILAGLQKAAVVFYATRAVRRGIEEHGLVDPARLVEAPYGVSPEFVADGPPAAAVAAATGGRPFVLHVGSCIPRKRVDVLLNVFAAVRRQHAGLLLVQVGGEWTAAQQDKIARLGLASAVIQLRDLRRDELAEFYRRAAVVLQPSEAEGFGLPVIEALACGAAVVASDLPVLREVGGEAAVYCPVADVGAWHTAVIALLDDPGNAPSRDARLARAQLYTWDAQARTIAEAYQRLAGSSSLRGTARP
jgi:glycosyltransferase involved in cell wall biosynthesis